MAGIAVMGGAEYAHRRGYEIQSQALTGGGAALLYLTLWEGQHLYGFMGSAATFPAMALVTVAAAVQAVRHESETVATLAWITGYAVPLLIGGGEGGGGESAGPGPLFAYLALLSVAVFVVGHRYAWPTFTGLALLGAYSSGAYIFRVSGGALGWTLTYLMLVTAGMLWVSASRKGREGENFGAIGAVAGYLVTAVVLLTASRGSPFVPYMYLLALSGAALWLGHMQDWRSMRWLGALGSFAGFLLLLPLIRRAGVEEMGTWMLLYAAMSVGGTLAVSAGRRPDAEPLALSAVGTAYAAAAILAWASPVPVAGVAMFAYLLLLAASVLVVGALFPWSAFSAIGGIAAFLATGLLHDGVTGGAVSHLSLMYLALLGAGALGVSAYRDNRTLGIIAVVGAFAALPLTGMMGPAAPELVIPTYLALAAIATLIAIEWRGWHGLEWVTLIGTWALYVAWRNVSGHAAPDPAHLSFTPLYLLAFVVTAWRRHGVRAAGAGVGDAALACANAAAFFGAGFYDLHRIEGASGLLALGLVALYATAGVTAIRRRPAQTWFGPLHVGLSVVFLTLAVPLLARGWPVSALWAAEVVLLMGLGFAFRAPALRSGALVVLALPLVRAMVVDSSISPDGYQVVANSRALSMLAVIAAMYICGSLYLRFREQLQEGERTNATGLLAFATVLLVWICSSEAWCYVGWQLGMDRAAQHFALSGVWVIFGAALMVIGTARNIVALRWAALGLWGVTVLKIFAGEPPLETYLPLINAHAAPLLAIAALLYALGAWYARTDHVSDSERDVGTAVVVVATGLLLWVASSEAWLYLGWQTDAGRAGQQMALSMIWVIFGSVMLVMGLQRNSAALRWVGLAALGLVAGKVFLVDPGLTPETYRLLANHYAFPLLVITAMLYLASHWYRRNLEHVGEEEEIVAGAIPYLASVLLWWVLTWEAWHFAGWTLGAEGDPQQYALSAVWTVYGAALITFGLLRSNAPIRWIGMGLLAITVLKVFLLDMRALDIFYRILALLGIGIALIAVGFGYQRLVREEVEQTDAEH
ncbi:MAG: DUF2339 domain-containing protein [Armatimonadota bacterium]|nr:DUF2339 domain-containing protein [Armatimonadota bacterium]